MRWRVSMSYPLLYIMYVYIIVYRIYVIYKIHNMYNTLYTWNKYNIQYKIYYIIIYDIWYIYVTYIWYIHIIYIHIYIYISVYILLTGTHTHTYQCMYQCMCIVICIYIYTYISTTFMYMYAYMDINRGTWMPTFDLQDTSRCFLSIPFINLFTLPETNIAPENWWLDYFPLGMAYFQGRAVSLPEGNPKRLVSKLCQPNKTSRVFHSEKKHVGLEDLEFPPTSTERPLHLGWHRNDCFFAGWFLGCFLRSIWFGKGPRFHGTYSCTVLSIDIQIHMYIYRYYTQ